jgi:peroxiredoxin family protein
MKSESKKKIIHYKRAVLTNIHVTLQSLLDDALNEKSPAFKAKARREVINPDDESCRLINHHEIYNGMTFGQLVFFEPGKSQSLITIDDDSEFFKINSITPESIDNKSKNKREFVDSFLYFGVFDNHVVVMQSTALKTRELETHLAWLLGTLTDVLDKNSALILQDKPSEETITKIESSPVKSVQLGTPVETRMEQETEETKKQEIVEAQEGGAKKVKWIPCGMGVDVMRAALGADWFNKLELKDSLDEANLQVSLEITYLRKTTKNGQKMLDNIATSLRHIDEADVKIGLHGGGTIHGGDLKLSGSVSVKTFNGLVDESDLYHQMHTWLVAKVRANEIETDEE